MTDTGQQPNAAVSLGKVVSGVGCLMVLAVVAFIAVSAWLAGRQTDSALEQTWARLPSTARDAYCESIQRDPSFNGSAVGLAAMAGGDVTQYVAKSFLLERCPLTGSPDVAPPPANDGGYVDTNGNGAWDLGEPRH